MYSQEALDQRYHLRHVPEVRQMLLEWCARVSIAHGKCSHGKCSARCLSGAESGLRKVGRLAEGGLLAASGLLPTYYRLLVIYYY